MMVRKQKFALVILIFFSLCPLVTTVTADFDPTPVGAYFSDIDEGVYVQLIFETIDEQIAFVPDDVDTLPRPELYIVMGGLKRADIKNVSITTFNKNSTTKKYDVFYDQEYFNMSLDSSSFRYYAVQRVEFPVQSNTSLLCIFEYLDIYIEFYYEPNPVYAQRKITALEYIVLVIFWIFVSVAVVLFANYSGKLLQRQVNVVPPFPILSVGALFGSVGFFLLSFTAMTWGYTWIERLAHLLTETDLFLLEFPIWFCATLFFGNQFTPQNTRILQQDFSFFRVSEGADIIAGQPGNEFINWKNVEWVKDMNMMFTVYRVRQDWYICDPNSWREFFWRFFGFRIRLKGHETSIQPDTGIWYRNDQRLYVQITFFEWIGDLKLWKLLPTGISPNPNVNFHGFAKTIGIILIGAICYILAFMNVLDGWPSTLLGIIGIIIIIYSVIGKGMLFEMKLTGCEYRIECNKHREAEVILNQQEEFLGMQQIMSSQDAEIQNLKAHMPFYVSKKTREFIEAIERVQLYSDYIQKQQKAPTKAQIDAMRSVELGHKTEEKKKEDENTNDEATITND